MCCFSQLLSLDTHRSALCVALTAPFAHSQVVVMARATRRAAATDEANMAAMNITGVPDARYPDGNAEFSGMYKCVCPESDTGLCDQQRRNHMFGNVTISIQ